MLSEKLKEYISDSSKLASSNVLVIKDGNLIFYSKYFDDSELNENTKISQELKDTIQKLVEQKDKNAYLRLEKMIELFEVDQYRYSGQAILPVIEDDNELMTLVYYRRGRDYIESSTLVMQTTRNFISEIMKHKS